MTKETLIKKTVTVLSQLPKDRLKEVSDFAEYILQKYDEEVLQNGMHKLVQEADTFHFLEEEEELYSPKDLKEKY